MGNRAIDRVFVDGARCDPTQVSALGNYAFGFVAAIGVLGCCSTAGRQCENESYCRNVVVGGFHDLTPFFLGRLV